MSDVTTAAVLIAHDTVRGGESAWSAVISVLAVCGVGAMYGKGVQELWARRGVGAVVSAARALAFAAGLATMLLAVGPPVDLVARGSFTGHMVQHMVMLMVAGPLLGLGGAALPLMLALPHRTRRRFARLRVSAVGRWLRRPAHRAVIGVLLFTAVLWAWHLPALYVLAEHNAVVHAAQHGSYLLIAWMLWAAVLTSDKHRLTGPLAFLLLFAIGMTGAALGAVLTFAPIPLYPLDILENGGSGPLADQQLAGLVMWIPMDVVVMGLALTIFGRWLTDLDRRFPADRMAIPEPDVAQAVSR